MKFDQELQLTNSLLQRLYPGIGVATADVPIESLDSCEQAAVAQGTERMAAGSEHQEVIRTTSPLYTTLRPL
jgi:hypothetical protein